MRVPLFPKRVEIEFSSACNLRCTYCPRHFLDNLNGFMDFSIYKNIIDEISDYPDTILTLHRRGESLLHPQFIKMLEYIKGKFQTVQLATNATLLDEKKARAIINSVTFLSFSIDTPDNFNKTRIPAKYENVNKNIIEFIKMNESNGHPVKTQVSMVKTKETSDYDISLFKDIWLHKIDRIRIYEQHSEDGKFGSLKNKRYDRKPCTMPFYELLIYCDGKVARCNHDWDGSPMGDIINNKIKDIWHNQKYKSLRQQHLTLNIKDLVCSNCESWYPSEGSQETGIVIKNER